MPPINLSRVKVLFGLFLVILVFMYIEAIGKSSRLVGAGGRSSLQSATLQGVHKIIVPDVEPNEDELVEMRAQLIAETAYLEQESTTSADDMESDNDDDSENSIEEDSIKEYTASQDQTVEALESDGSDYSTDDIEALDSSVKEISTNVREADESATSSFERSEETSAEVREADEPATSAFERPNEVNQQKSEIYDEASTDGNDDGSTTPVIMGLEEVDKEKSESDDEYIARPVTPSKKEARTNDKAKSQNNDPSIKRIADLLEKYPQCKSTRRGEFPGFMNGPRAQYIHNPKSGGTSIQKALVKYARRNPLVKYFKFDGNDVHGTSYKCPPGTLSKSFLAGHRGFGFCKDVERHKRGLLTIMNFRDAVSRMVSWYDYYLYHLREERAVKVYGSLNKPLKEIIKMYHSTAEIEQGEVLLRYSGQQQARFLCGYECMGPSAQGNKTQTEQFVLSRALENLKKLDVIGITEELDKMTYQLRFHMPQIFPSDFTSFPRDNPTKRRSVLDDEAKEILKSWGWVDARLYEEAKKLYKEKQAISEECVRLFSKHESPLRKNETNSNEVTEDNAYAFKQSNEANTGSFKPFDGFGPD